MRGFGVYELLFTKLFRDVQPRSQTLFSRGVKRLENLAQLAAVDTGAVVPATALRKIRYLVAGQRKPDLGVECSLLVSSSFQRHWLS